MAAVAEVDVAADRLAQPLRPVHHRRKRRGGGQAEPDGRDRREPLGLHQGVDELRGTDHHRGDRRAGGGSGPQRVERRHHSGEDVRRGGALHGGDHGVPVEHDRVGVGSADVDTDPHAIPLPAAEACPVYAAGARPPRTSPSAAAVM